jgi:uncharacterized protein VirK/YbjX
LFSSSGKEAAYDGNWQECRGPLNSEGFFVISTELRQREPSEIPSRKRAQYRRRYELIRDIQQQINHSFATNDSVVMNHQNSDQIGGA